ncbi:PE-PPE domain-containing protein [Mycolicibacterium pulveris]
MDATTFPMPSRGYMESAINDFIAPTVFDPAGYTPVAVRQRSQIIGINQSVEGGIDLLVDAMADQSEPFVVFGFSQSTVVSMRVKADLAERKARGEEVPDVTFVGIGVGNRPNGGISSRLAGITIPFFDFTFDGAAPTDSGFKTFDIAREFDGLADTPQFLLNPVSTLNAIFGVLFVHLLYGPEVSLDPNSPKYVPGTVVQQYGDTTYYWIPTADLPLFDPFRLLGVPEQVIDVFEPFFRVLVDAGYDRSIPFGEPVPAQLIPVIDPVTLAIQLASAVVEGANNAAKLVGGQLPGYGFLTTHLSAAEGQSSNVIGAPYRAFVREINENFNPFQTFAAFEGPIAKAFDSVVNALGVPHVLNQLIDPVLFPLTAWAEENLLFPPPDAPLNPLIPILRRVAPHLGTPAPESGDADEVPSAASDVEPVSQTERDSDTEPVSETESDPDTEAASDGDLTLQDDASLEDDAALVDEVTLDNEVTLEDDATTTSSPTSRTESPASPADDPTDNDADPTESATGQNAGSESSAEDAA